MNKRADEERGKRSEYERVQLIDRYFKDKHSNTPRYCDPYTAATVLQTADDGNPNPVKRVVRLYERAFCYRVSYHYNGRFGTLLQCDLFHLLRLYEEAEKVKLKGQERQQKLDQLKKDILG